MKMTKKEQQAEIIRLQKLVTAEYDLTQENKDYENEIEKLNKDLKDLKTLNEETHNKILSKGTEYNEETKQKIATLINGGKNE